MATKHEIIARNAKKAVQVKTNMQYGALSFNNEIEEHLSDNGKAYRMAFEQLSDTGESNEWRKAYIMNQLWIDFSKHNPKAKKADFQSFY